MPRQIKKSSDLFPNSAISEDTVRENLRARIDSRIEAEVLKLDRDAEIAEAEEGIIDFADLLNE